MLVAILTGLVVALWLDRMFFKGKDKVARKGLEALASEFNREVCLYDFIEEASIYTKDFSKELARDNKIFKLKMEVLEIVKKDMLSLRDFMDNKIEKSNERISTLAKKAEQVDLQTAQGIDALANHLKLEIVPFHQKEEIGFKIIKLKK